MTHTFVTRRTRMTKRTRDALVEDEIGFEDQCQEQTNLEPNVRRRRVRRAGKKMAAKRRALRSRASAEKSGFELSTENATAAAHPAVAAPAMVSRTGSKSNIRKKSANRMPTPVERIPSMSIKTQAVTDHHIVNQALHNQKNLHNRILKQAVDTYSIHTKPLRNLQSMMALWQQEIEGLEIRLQSPKTAEIMSTISNINRILIETLDKMVSCLFEHNLIQNIATLEINQWEESSSHSMQDSIALLTAIQTHLILHQVRPIPRPTREQHLFLRHLLEQQRLRKMSEDFCGIPYQLCVLLADFFNERPRSMCFGSAIASMAVAAMEEMRGESPIYQNLEGWIKMELRAAWLLDRSDAEALATFLRWMRVIEKGAQGISADATRCFEELIRRTGPGLA